MLRFSALIPDATINYIKNPSMRYDTTDWNVAGSTLTRSLEQARFGISSLKVVTAGTALRQGAFYRVSALSGVSEPITVSAYVRGTGRVRIRLINNPTGMEWASQSIQLETTYWQRIWVSGFSTGSNDLRLYVETDETAAVARTFYVDGAQLERKSYPTTFCDGEQPGCRWNGLYHNSTSQRPSTTRAGGRWVQLSGPEREAQDLYMTVAGGLGVAPVTNNIQSFALAPGGYFQNAKTETRQITLTFHAKHKVDDQDEPVSLAALHQLRQLLIDVVKPDKTGGNEEIWFEYYDGNTPLYFQARYNGGLGGEWDVRNQFVNSFPLNLLAVSPLMVEDSQDVAVFDIQDTINPSLVLGRIDGRWNTLNGGLNDDVKAWGLGLRGEVYAVGEFTAALVGGASVPMHRVAYWDGSVWNSLNATVPVGIGPIDIAVAPNGYVYVTGDFLSIGGVAANRVAYWNGTAWNAMGTGLNNVGNAIKIAPNGDVYVGGAFTTAGGVACFRIARWDGLTWRRLGQFGGLSGTVLDLAISQDGTTLYACGLFADQEGFAASNGMLRVASYNISTGLFAAMGAGFNAQVTCLALTLSGVLYAGGTFGASGSDTMNGVAMWNGGAWVAMGSGVGGLTGVSKEVTDLAFFDNGNLLLVGDFTTAGGKPARYMALWNGSTFANLDMELQNTNLIACLVIPKTDDIFVGGVNFTAPGVENTKVSGITTVTNSGSTEAQPVIYVLGPGTLRWIENQTNQKRIYLDMTILQNEEVFFDFGRGEVFSTQRGSLFYAVLAGSDFRSFKLMPGDNTLACFMINDVNAQMQVSLTPYHWSADATQNGEEL